MVWCHVGSTCDSVCSIVVFHLLVQFHAPSLSYIQMVKANRRAMTGCALGSIGPVGPLVPWSKVAGSVYFLFNSDAFRFESRHLNSKALIGTDVFFFWGAPYVG